MTQPPQPGQLGWKPEPIQVGDRITYTRFEIAAVVLAIDGDQATIRLERDGDVRTASLHACTYDPTPEAFAPRYEAVKKLRRERVLRESHQAIEPAIREFLRPPRRRGVC